MAFIRFAKWLRQRYQFPIRMPVYLFPGEYIVTMKGESVTASFFAPDDSNVEPFIRVATGDYPKLKADRGRDDALAAFICSLAHEVVHYQQWLSTGRTLERGVARKAVAILRQYERETPHP